MATPFESDFYQVGGMQVDVNPFDRKSSDCDLLLNFYSKHYLAKKVRFGYAKFLDNPDGQPVRNLIFYQFPLESGLLRVSGKETYVSTTQTGSWGSPIPDLSWSTDVVVGNTTLTGITNYVHLSTHDGGYHTWDGTTALRFGGGFTPDASFLTTFQSRVIGDINHLSIAESFVNFDLSLPVAAAGDPFYFDSNSADPSQGGTTTANPGNNGSIVGLSVVQNSVIIYRQRSVTRFDGSNFLTLNFGNSVLEGSICSSDYSKIDYFLSYNSIYACDGSTIAPVSFGVNTIIQDTFTNLGIPNPHSFCFDYLSFFWIGNIWYQPYPTSNPITIPNAMFVKDERFGEWYIWSIGHEITAFGSYEDENNVRHMITGDSEGNTWVWGEQYTSDGDTPINYQLRTRYQDHGVPSGSKIPQPQIVVSADPSAEADVSVGRDFQNKYEKIGVAKGIFSKFNVQAFSQYKVISIQVSGSTTTNRPEFYGYSIPVVEEERFSDSKTSRTSRG